MKHLGRNKSLVGDEEFVDYLIDQIELPAQFGFAPTRWAQALQTMLPKDKGTPKVTRLRVIQLFEVYYNFLLRIIWGRRLVWNAQKYGVYMPTQ